MPIQIFSRKARLLDYPLRMLVGHGGERPDRLFKVAQRPQGLALEEQGIRARAGGLGKLTHRSQAPLQQLGRMGGRGQIGLHEQLAQLDIAGCLAQDRLPTMARHGCHQRLLIELP